MKSFWQKFRKYIKSLSGEDFFLLVVWLAFSVLVYFSENQHFFRFLVKFILYSMLIIFLYKYLIPVYLKKKSIWLYFVLGILVSAILAPPHSLMNFLSSRSTPNIYSDLFVSFLNFVIIFFFASVFIILADWLKSQRLMRSLQKENMQSELKFLRSQVNPHFLFNTLNSLYALTLKKSDKAPEIVIKLSEIMRYMLYECNEPYVPLEKEIQYMKNYVELEQLRHGEEINISFRNEANTENKFIAPLMFVPFFENSFKHGIDHEIQTGYIDILFRSEDDRIVLEIENTKSRHTPTKLSSAGGIGLPNIRRRLELLYPNSYQLKIDNSDEEIYSVYLSIKTESNEY